MALRDKRRLGRAVIEPDFTHVGPDAAEVSRDVFRERVGRGTIALKARLLDQKSIAGVGNLLADETLWQAKLSPRRVAGELTDDELDHLRRELRKATRAAISRAASTPASSSPSASAAPPARAAGRRSSARRSAAGRPSGARRSRPRRDPQSRWRVVAGWRERTRAGVSRRRTCTNLHESAETCMTSLGAPSRAIVSPASPTSTREGRTRRISLHDRRNRMNSPKPAGNPLVPPRASSLQACHARRAITARHERARGARADFLHVSADPCSFVHVCLRLTLARVRSRPRTGRPTCP